MYTRGKNLSERKNTNKNRVVWISLLFISEPWLANDDREILPCQSSGVVYQNRY